MWLWCEKTIWKSTLKLFTASVHLGLDGNWKQAAHTACHSYVPLTCTDNSFSWAVVTFEVAPHQAPMCPPGTKVVIYSGLLLITEQRVSDTCQNTGWGGGQYYPPSTRGCISTTARTGLIKHNVPQVAEHWSSKLSLLSAAHNSLQWWARRETVKWRMLAAFRPQCRKEIGPLCEAGEPGGCRRGWQKKRKLPSVAPPTTCSVSGDI